MGRRRRRTRIRRTGPRRPWSIPAATPSPSPRPEKPIRRPSRWKKIRASSFQTTTAPSGGKALTTLSGMTRDADAARRKIAGIHTALISLTDSWKLPNAPKVPDSVKKAADDLLAKVKPVFATFEARGRRRAAAGGGPFVPPPVTQKIARLMNGIDGYTAAPTTRQMADLAEAQAQLQAGIAEVNRLWDEVPRAEQDHAGCGRALFHGDASGSGNGWRARGKLNPHRLKPVPPWFATDFKSMSRTGPPCPFSGISELRWQRLQSVFWGIN